MTTRQWQSIGAETAQTIWKQLSLLDGIPGRRIPGTQYKLFSTKGTNELHAPNEKKEERAGLKPAPTRIDFGATA
jgi:hypothetical protein